MSKFIKKNEKILTIGLIIIATIIALLIGINTKSLWGDECLVYKFINSSNAIEVLKKALNAPGSEKQMPLFLLFAWLWSRIFGLSEIAMRSVNILPAFLYMIYGYKITKAICKKKKVWLGTLFFLVNPMFIAYLNEARPYIALLSFALAIVYYSFYADDFNSKKNIILIHLFMLLGISFHLLFVFSFCIYACGILYHWQKNDLKFKEHLKVFLVAILFYILLLGYMAFTFYYSSSSSIGNASGSVIASLIVSIYYIFGYGGLGLSRNDLRSPSLSDLTPIMIILILALTIVLMLFVIALIKNIVKKPLKNRSFWVLLAAIILIVCFCLLSIVFNYSFWERHIISLSAIFIVLIVELISAYNMKYLAVALIILFSISSMNFRFNYYYGNEDYKSIIEDLNKDNYVIMAQGVAEVFDYYGKQFVKSDDFNNPNTQIINISNYSLDEVNDLVNKYEDKYDDMKIAIVLTSRPVNDKYQLYHEVDSFNLSNEDIVEYRGLKCFITK